MQIVIDIPEELYRAYKDRPPMLGDAGMDMIAQAIANGMVLPKEYGDLIDRQSLKLSFFTLSRFYKTWNLGKTKIMGEIENARTIIKASKESKG